MNGWQILGLSLALWCIAAVPAALLFGRLIAHGKRQPPAGRHTAPHTPAWARTDQHRRHR